ncbi:unnamed protein product [Anisakis simplex]|uniref:Vesicle transport protein n=1 Tax=Anisakis simplex TaxID=6269 RepID=A0A0M3K5C2_ANISI|nr:unnamed protein product [Anisakis simplex]
MKLWNGLQVKEYQAKLNEMQPVINERKDEMIAMIKDQSALSDIDNSKLSAVFVWAGVMLFAMSVAFILSKCILSSIIGLFVTKFYGIILAYTIMPALAYYYITTPIEGDANLVDRLRRFRLLGVALAEGALNGFLLCERAIPGVPPPASLCAFSVGLMPVLASSTIGNDRMKLIGVTVGGAFVMDLAIGCVTGLSAGFLVLCVLYSAAGFVILQIYLKKGKAEAVNF